jgi:hypothetical protein
MTNGVCVPLVFAGSLLLGCAMAQTAVPLAITYKISGAIQDSGSLDHPGDDTHLCSAVSLSALHTTAPDQPLEVPPGPPVYVVNYDSQAPVSQPGVYLKAFSYMSNALTHSDPADDWVQINAKGKLWSAHGSQMKWTDSFVFAADYTSGHLAAHGLVPRNADGSLAPGNSIDLDISWTCPN